MKIATIDYGAGNLASIERALQRLGADSERINSPKGVANATAILLPGVGHYSALIRALDERGLRKPLLDAIARRIPFLGICLGLQVLFESSQEAPGLGGLRLIRGTVASLPGSVKLPHMGWNQLRREKESRLLEGIDASAYFYFAHSFAVQGTNPHTAAWCSHGGEFVAVLENGNLFGTQFHPEKSGDAGARLLRNFLGLAA